jgi:hypothetical protein
MTCCCFVASVEINGFLSCAQETRSSPHDKSEALLLVEVTASLALVSYRDEAGRMENDEYLY